VADIGHLRVEIMVLGARLNVKVARHSDEGERVRVFVGVRERVKGVIMVEITRELEVVWWK
jgi:hypothetical protein